MTGNALILQPGRKLSPEQSLAAAILTQAFSDMSPGNSNIDHQATRERNDARTAMVFLTTTYGEMAKWRNELCDYLHLDGNVLAERVRMILNGDLPWPDVRETKKRTNDNYADAARSVWRDLKKAA